MTFRKIPFFNTTWTTVITAFLAIAISILALAGWLFNSEILHVFSQQWDSMKVNTALGILFSAFSLLLFASGKKRRLAIILAFIVLLLGTVSLCQYLFHWNAHIDELFFLDKITAAGHYPGRMPEITTIAFIVMGISLLFYPFDRKYLHRISEFSAILVLITSFAFFIAYFYSASPFFKTDQFTSNSLPTIFSGLLLSIGIIYSRPDKGFLAAFHRKTIAARVGVKGLFIILTTLVLLGWLCLKGEEAGLYNNTFSLAIRIIMYTVIFFIVTWSSTQSLNRAEAELQKSEVLYRSLVDQASDGILVTDIQGNIINVNPALCTMFGYTKEEGLQKNIKLFLDPEDVSLKPFGYQLLKDDQSHLTVRLAVHKDGTKFDIELNTKLIGDNKALSIIRDISERKKAEDKIRESEMKYRTLMQQAADSILLFSGSGELIESNLSARQLVGYSNEEYNKLSLKDLFFEEDLKVKPFQLDRLNKGESTINRRRLKRKDGTAVETEIHAKKLSDGRYLGVARDLTERIRSEELIIKERDLSNSIINSLPGLFYLCDETGKIIRWNSKNKIVYGYSVTEISHMNCLDFFEGEEKELVRQRIKDGFANGETNAEAHIVTKTGEKILFYFTGIAIDFKGKKCLIGTGIDITERKKAEEGIRKSEEQYRDLVDNITDLICTHDLNGRVLSANKAAEKLIGFKFIQDSNLNIKDILTANTIDNFQLYIDEIKKKGHAKGLMKVQTATGEIRIWEYNNSLKTTGTGTTIVRGYARDITEKKKTEDEIKKQKEQYDDLVRNIPVGVYKFRMKPDGRMSLDYISPRLCKMVGVNEETAYRDIMSTFKLVHPDDYSEFIRLIEKSFHTENRFLWEGRTIINGQVNWVKIESSPKLLKNGDVLWDGVIADITERKRSEAEIEEKNEALKITLMELNDIIENSTDTIFKLDLTGKLIFISPEFYRALGFTPEEMQGKHFEDIVFPDDIPFCQAAFLKGIQMRVPQRDLIYRVLAKDGRVKWSNTSASLVCNESGDPLYILGISKDITELKEASAMLEASQERYKAFIQQSSEAIWRGEFTEPVNCKDPVDKQLQQFYEKGYLAECNDQMAKLYGFKKVSELIGTKLSDFIRINADLTRALSLQFVQNGYRLHRTPSIQVDTNGNKRYYLNNLVGIVENGFVVRVWCMQTDITEQRLAEKKIWHLASLVDNTTDIIISHNLKLEIISWNKSAEKIYEVPASEAIGKLFHEVVSVEYLNTISRESILQQVFENGSCNNEMLFINAGGKKIFLSVIISKWFDASGLHKGFLSIAREITEVYMAREKLETSEQFYKSLIRDSVDGTVVMDEKGYITYVAPSITNVLGYTMEETLGKRADEFIFPEDVVTGHKIFFDEINEVSTSWYHEVRYVTKDDRVIWMMMRAHNMLKNPYVKGIAVYFTDITKRKSIEIELYQSEERLRNSLEEVRRLSEHLQDIREEERITIAREIHDELGQQLTGLKMDLHWLKRKIKSEDEEVNNKLNKNIELINATITSVRKIATALRPSILDDLGLLAALEWQGEEFEKRSGTKVKFINKVFGLTVKPEAATAIFRIYQELLTNIARHANAASVNTLLQQDEKMLYFSVRDNGVGFNKETISKKKTLGLLGIKERALLLGGHFEIKTRPGKGVEIIISIPLNLVHVAV